LSRRESTQNLVDPSDFFTRTMGEAHSVSSPSQVTMTPAFFISSMHWSTTPAAKSGRRRGCCLIGVASPVLIRWRKRFVNPSSPFNEKASRYSSRMEISHFLWSGVSTDVFWTNGSRTSGNLAGIRPVRQLLIELVNQRLIAIRSPVGALGTSG